MPVINCMITAAELSSRMGQRKMVLSRQQGTTLDTSIRNALQFCSQIISVTGYRGNELYKRYANQSNITIIRNPDYAQDLLTSVKATIPAVQVERCLLTHGNAPTLTIDIFRKIWSLRNDSAALPLHNGVPDHPISVSKPCLMQAIQRPDIINMRQALPMGEHYSVKIENVEIILDIDIPDDSITAKKRYTEIQKAQLDDYVQISNPSSALCHNDKKSLTLRKERK